MLVRYSWCGSQLFSSGPTETNEDLVPEDLISLEPADDFHGEMNGNQRPRVIIGHNVGFDRSFIREQYYVMVISWPYCEFRNVIQMNMLVT